MPGKLARSSIRRDCRCPRVRHQHGTYLAYSVDRCGCFPCRVAHAEAARSYRAGGNWREADLVPVCGTRRRLRALAVIGYSAPAIGRELGISGDMAAYLRRDTEHQLVNGSTAAAVQRLYDRLWDKPDHSANGRRTSTQAKRNGWVPPLAWDDDEIDDPAAAPHNPANVGWEHKPCGTPAAARRHYRAGEPLDEACRNADRRAIAERRAAA